LTHQSVAEQNACLVTLFRPGVIAKKGAKLLYAGLIVFGLLRTVSFAENGTRAMTTCFVGVEIIVHHLAAAAELSIKRITHPAPVKGILRQIVPRILFPESLELRDGILVPLSL
jgi:hypothetical protein